jgi:monovalent cation:H+ antiporter-2, CPA2 family
LAAVITASAEVPPFLPELVVLVTGAALVGYVSSRLRVVPIVGFLLTGVAIGPHQLGLIDEPEVVEAAAEFGVILLLFTIGLEFSLERLARIWRLIVAGGGLQVVLTVALVAALALVGGVPAGPAVFTGFLVSLSSTAIVLKVLSERGRSSSAPGQAALAVLIFQDLAVVGMVLLVPILGGTGGGPGEVALALGTAAGLIATVLIVARRVMPRLLDVVARACSPEVFLLAVVAVCFGTALASAQAGVSVSLGAFLAGLVVSETRHGTHAFGEILPLQILFSAAFFVSVGMLLDLDFLLDEPLAVLGALAAVVLIKAVAGAVALRLAGLALPTAVGTAVLLAQVGEFSFVLEALGRDEGLFPLDRGDDGSQLLIGVTVLLMVATPLLATLGERAERRLAARSRPARPAPATVAVAGEGHRHGHVLVAGYGDAARAVVAEVRQLDAPLTVLTLNPDGAIEATADGLDVVVGDYAKRAVLQEAGGAAARVVVVADDEPERAHRVVAVARMLNPGAVIVIRPIGDVDLEDLAEAGADHVVTPERASQIGLGIALRAVLQGGDGRLPLSTVVRFRPHPDTPCPHLEFIRPVQPSAYGCEDCLRIGATWVHLRICLRCGHVGCCDSSPHRHARRHAEEGGHPIAASLEAGEDWAYCFWDATTIEPEEPATAATTSAAPGEL